MHDVQDQVVAAIVQWAIALPRPQARTRINLRLTFGSSSIAQKVADALRARSVEECAWVVRASTDNDAVRLRNSQPDWVPRGASLIYLVFWLPGHVGHDRNFESLRDIPPVTLDDFLSHSSEFVLECERGVTERIHDAFTTWPERTQDRGREHLLAAWNALRLCLRERGRDRSLRYVRDLAAYLSWVNAAGLSEDEWQQTPPDERARRLVVCWGENLPTLGMFKLPALASVTGIFVDPRVPIPSPSRTGERRWADYFDEMLSENVETATNFPGLEEAIAGNQTLRERLDDLVQKVPLCQDSSKQQIARQALERFCESGDEAALNAVEWQFLKDETDRGSASQGLKGLLIARKLRSPQTNPLDKLEADTVATLEELAGAAMTESGLVRQFVAEMRKRATDNRTEALTTSELLRAISAGLLPPGAMSAHDRDLLAAVLNNPDRRPSDFERLARAWERHGRPDADAPIEADSLMLGLLRLCHSRLVGHDLHQGVLSLRQSAEPAGELELSVHVEGKRVAHSTPVSDWSIERRTALHAWLRDKVRPLYFEVEPSDGDGEELREIAIDVTRVVNGKSSPFGAIGLVMLDRRAELLAATRWHTLTSAQIKQDFNANHLLDELFLSEKAERIGQDPEDEALRHAWSAWRQAGGTEPGWNYLAIVSPLPSEARAWVTAWSSALAKIDPREIENGELARIQRELAEPSTLADPIKLQRLASRMAELISGTKGRPAISVREVRKLLSLCTGVALSKGRPQYLVLTPHHPLVLRLRIIAEDLIAETLTQLWARGWDRRVLADLDGALDEWGLPEPVHCYGAWDGDPLVFDSWLEDGFGQFSALGANREADTLALGFNQVANELRKYGELSPAAADRLQLRFVADRGGHWAWNVLSAALGDKRMRADVRIVTDVPPRQPLQLDIVVQKEELSAQKLEPGADGELPELRVRREDPRRTQEDVVHVNAVVGEVIDELRSSMSMLAASSRAESYDVFDHRVLFHEAVPELAQFSFDVTDPPDGLSIAVARAVAFAASHPAQVFCERYSFDPSRCRYPLQELQQKAHWLVLASRQPLYRALQQSATSTLLDFYSVSVKGRPVHICVGIDSQRAEESGARLGHFVETLVASPVDRSQAMGMLGAARALAPGLAMRCISSTGSIELSGLVGLLLSAHAATRESTESLLLSLDQHQELLSGSGQLSDLVLITLANRQVVMSVVEAKFATGSVSVDSTRIQEAARQVQSTIERMRRFTIDHPLALRTRTRLARAIVHRIHLGANASEQAGRWSSLVDAVLDPTVEIKVEPAPTAIHAWSVSGDTVSGTHRLLSGEVVKIHDRSETIEAMKQLQ